MRPEDREARAWALAWDFWIRWEGVELHRVSGDPGGATRYGIAGRFHPELELESLEIDQAAAFLRGHYWRANRCDLVAWTGAPLTAWSLFDFCGHSRAEVARMALQRALGGIKVDGALGQRTLDRLAWRVSPETPGSDLELALALVEARSRRAIERVLEGRSPGKFLVGWSRRFLDLAASLAKEGE